MELTPIQEYILDKDLFDLWALLAQKKFTVPQLLTMVAQKFGSKFTEFSFWSESAKSIKQLQILIPYITSRDEQKKQQMLKEVEDYFLEGARIFLSRQLD